MSYLVCEKCGKYYELPEGKASFNFSKCGECGGRLRYVNSLNEIPMIKSKKVPPVLKPSTGTCPKCGSKNPDGVIFCLNCGQNLHTSSVETFNLKTKKDENTGSGGLNFLGVLVGFTFLIMSLMFTGLALFGTKIPHNLEDVSKSVLTACGLIAIIITIISGLLTSYVGGNRNYRDGVMSSGLLGLILSLFVGAMGGVYLFLIALGFFCVLTIFGGIIGTFLRRHSD